MNTMETNKQKGKENKTHMNVTKRSVGQDGSATTDCTHAHTRTTRVGKKGKPLT
jgi:hypothetical protein